MKSATFQIYRNHSDRLPNCQETQQNNISTFKMNKITCIFRTSGHQNLVEIQQTRCPEKNHTDQDHEKLFESYTLLSLGITILQGW